MGAWCSRRKTLPRRWGPECCAWYRYVRHELGIGGGLAAAAEPARLWLGGGHFWREVPHQPGRLSKTPPRYQHQFDDSPAAPAWGASTSARGASPGQEPGKLPTRTNPRTPPSPGALLDVHRGSKTDLDLEGLESCCGFCPPLDRTLRSRPAPRQTPPPPPVRLTGASCSVALGLAVQALAGGGSSQQLAGRRRPPSQPGWRDSRSEPCADSHLLLLRSSAVGSTFR